MTKTHFLAKKKYIQIFVIALIIRQSSEKQQQKRLPTLYVAICNRLHQEIISSKFWRVLAS